MSNAYGSGGAINPVEQLDIDPDADQNDPNLIWCVGIPSTAYIVITAIALGTTAQKVDVPLVSGGLLFAAIMGYAIATMLVFCGFVPSYHSTSHEHWPWWGYLIGGLLSPIPPVWIYWIVRYRTKRTPLTDG